ncbi:MAG: division/cell wall cluster transcriptional repressor MraZ [Candidatus Portnoybacteria bacterium]|nr:division/cell wall cluster transcriptional repressor MraZ [Candidatus Portnoybacteria bacterium]
MLIGEYKHILDIKKRLAIPSKLRKEIGRGAVLTRGLDNSLALYPAKEWQKMVDKISQLPSGKIDARGFSRIILAGAAPVEFDSLGRILIPDYLKQYAELKKNVVVVGIYSRLEIWNEEKWNAYKKRMESEVGNMAERLGELGV